MCEGGTRSPWPEGLGDFVGVAGRRRVACRRGARRAARRAGHQRSDRRLRAPPRHRRFGDALRADAPPPPRRSRGLIMNALHAPRPRGFDKPVSLSEVLDRVLNKGVVVTGEVMISVAGIDLVYLGLNVV